MVKKEYRVLPTIEVIEGLLLMGKVISCGTLDVKSPKISDEIYINIIKLAVEGEI